MYHGLHPNANPLQQTYDQLQNRAIQELNDEIKRLKDIIIDKDGDINKLKEITNQGTLQKKLANVLEENNTLKLHIKEYKNNKERIKQLTETLDTKNEEMYRFQEKINLLNDEYKELLHKNQDLNQELIQKTKIIENTKHKDDEIDALNNKITKYEKLIYDLKNVTKINDLEIEINKLKQNINTITDEKHILTQNNKHLTTIHDEIKAKYSKLLNNFDKNMQENQLKNTKYINSLNDDITDLNKKYNSEKNKNDSLKKQMKELQQSLSEMEKLNLKLIKGYNLEDVINDLQNEKNKKLNLQNELKQITKKLSKKEKTNLVLLNKNKTLSQTLSLSKNHINILNDDDEESTHFDHVEEIDTLQQNIEMLHKHIDKLESDKYKLLTQIHENQEHDDDDDDALAFSGLTKQQQTKVKQFVKKIRKRSLMPTHCDEDEDEDGDEVQHLKQENETLKEWKDTLMTKLFETQQTMHTVHTVDTVDTIRNEEDGDDMKKEEQEIHREDRIETMFMNTNNMIFDITSKQTLKHLLGISYDDINTAEHYVAEIKEMSHNHREYVNVVLSMMDDGNIQNIQNIDHDTMCALNKENAALNEEIQTLKGYKIRHSKIESILKEKDESELIKKVDEVSKENMILIVNQKTLSKKYVDIKKHQMYLFNQYKKLLKYLMETEHYLFEKLCAAQGKNEHLCIFISSLLQNISNKMVPLDEYKNIEIECQSLYQTKDHLISIIDRFETYSIKYFECKRDNIHLENQLIDITKEMEGKCTEQKEIIYNAEMVEDDNENNKKIKSSIKTTEEQYEKIQKKYENALSEMKEMEENSAKLHAQITELRSICLDQSNTISRVKKQLHNDHCDLNKYNDLEIRYHKLKAEYERKLVEIEQFKQKTAFAVSSLQTLQTKIISALDIDDNNDTESEFKKIENILKKTQNINSKLAVNEQSIKSLKDKICSLEIEILKNEQKYNTLQTQYFNLQKAKRFLEANFNCIYSKTLHKISSKYLSEIDNLRNVNEDLYEYLHEEQSKTKDIYRDMIDHKIIIESYKVKVENCNTLIKQYDTDESTKKYLKNWQNKCTNLEIKHIELVNHDESLQNEIVFLRNENKKYLANIGSLQKKLSVSNQELQDTKREIVEKYQLHELKALQEKVEDDAMVVTETKSVQTQHENDQDSKNKIDEEKMDKLQSKIVSLQSLIRTLQNESIHTEERVNGATEGLQIMLKTAQESIESLQILLTQKNESIEEYKNMIDKLLKKLKEQQMKYTQHIMALKLKYDIDEKHNDEIIISQIKHNHLNNNEWVELTQMKTTIQEKECIINKLEKRNVKLTKHKQENETKIDILNTRIDEYHNVIQELNDKISHLSESLSLFKTKLNSKKKENLHLQKAVKTLKNNMEKKRDIMDENRNVHHNETKEDEMDDKMKKMENEYKILRSSLRSEMDDRTLRLNESQIRKKQLMTKNNDLIREMEKIKDNLENKKNVIHKLQIQISKIQKDKITMQEKHSITLKIHKKKMNNLEKTVHNLKTKAESEHNQIDNLRNKLNEKESEINKLNTNHQKLIKIKKNQQKEIVEMRNEIEILQQKQYEEPIPAPALNAFCNEKEIVEMRNEIEKLKIENKSIKRKYDLLNGANVNFEMTKLFDEMEMKENKIIDLETKINELNFEREDLEIKYNKIQKQKIKTDKTVISSRNDPELQNLLDSMRFIINKLKKENQSLKDNNKQNQSWRITNLLKENRNLKRKINELNEINECNDNQYKDHEIEQKRLEIERITNVNKRLRKENVHLKETNSKYIKSDSLKKDNEIAHLRKVIGDERDDLKHRINETEMIWKRKISMTNDDLLRYKKIKKDLESELTHKNEMNQKMSAEIKALIELIDHTKSITNQHSQNEKASTVKVTQQIQELQKENDELRSELSAFDVSFFNEIEDLKYREAQAQQMIIELQSRLQTNTNNVLQNDRE